ncbi:MULTISPECIES: hypothetical protein [Paenarthrobacter]|uniref:Uncharacterized protein n=1 Tax=Paenarthrobacter ureafaciens TaxID=37931 RepID=A0AAX3EQ61_PAEUR|nr:MULTISPECIES: hypothetical protein [Paenarthrobacter]MDO5878089.1 hypothetical protein [Paenarthrobacter sp. SD-1]UYW00020.1 hypothetical protein NL394_22675 [Paenarthrobacter ureafaciens]WIV33503.1 hypothetical protein QN084_22825 [Paenarthrobacter sp. R1]
MSKQALWLQRALLRPVWTIIALGVIAFTIEVCQQWPEFFFPGHAIGEVVRNLAYALIGAVLFNWILIEIPAQRRRRIAYPRHRLAFQLLVQSGAHMLAYYRGAAHLLDAETRTLDAWNRETIEACVYSIYEKVPAIVDERRQLLAVHIMGLQAALDGLEAATEFLDPDVAMALALFPAAKGFQQLQPPEASDPQPWQREAHIAWELLEGSRRLYQALQANAPQIDLEVEEGVVSFSYGSTWHVNLSDLVR